MKSKLFENINDRQNIINAYCKMVNESESDLDIINSKKEGMTHPVAVYDENGEDTWFDIDNIEYKKSQDYGVDDYYIELAVDNLGFDEIYQKLISDYMGYNPSAVEIERGGVTNNMSDLYHDIVEIGKEYEDSIHADDINVNIPTWSASYIVNDDPSALEDAEIKMVDDYIDSITKDGYKLVLDYNDSGSFCSSPEFGDATDCMRGWLVKDNRGINDNIQKNKNESFENNANSEDDIGGWFDESGLLVKDIPEDVVQDCSQRMGHDNYENCKHWVEQLGFDKGLDIAKAKGYLKSTGGWEEDEIRNFDAKETAIRVLWLACNDIRDGNSDFYIGDSEPFAESCEKMNSSLSHEEIKELKRKNPDIKMISEEGDVDADVDDDGVYHEFPQIKHRINSYRQKARLNPDGESKYDELFEELHTALNGCTKGIFSDECYEGVNLVMKKLEEIGVYVTTVKVENYGQRSDGLRAGKNYYIDASWTNKYGQRMLVHGKIIVAFCGTVDEPEKRYDVCCYFWVDDDKYIRIQC